MVNVYSIKGVVKGKVNLPANVFNTEYRPDLIQRAVLTLQANKRQMHGVDPTAGLMTSADYYGRRRGGFRQTINRGMSRLPRIKPGGGGLGAVKRVPQAVGGRRAHPPKMRDYSRKMNKKEYMFALKSAIAATQDINVVNGRGHVTDNVKEIPLVVEDSLQGIDKTKEVIDVLENLGLGGELERAGKKKIRAGKGKMRGRRYKRRTGVLLVIDKDEGIKRIGNIPGLDVINLRKLDVELLAPGTHPGRLVIWTESALNNMGEITT